jgi:hypothetical protein
MTQASSGDRQATPSSTTTIHRANMIFANFADNTMQTLLASAPQRCSAAYPITALAEPAAAAHWPIDGNESAASARNVSNVTEFLAVEILP